MTDDLISREALRRRMYHDSFETDNGMQKWDSGLWIRYKIFENAIEEAPPADVVEVVRCKDCVHLELLNSEQYYARCSWHGRLFQSFGKADTSQWFCADGERMDET